MDEHELLETLLELESFIKRKYVLCQNYGGLRSNELTECNPPNGYIVEQFLKNKHG